MPRAQVMVNLPYISRWRLALAVWLGGLLLFGLLGLSAQQEVRREAEKRQSSEAGRTAAQLAALLSLPAWELDELTARTIIMAAMEDDDMYAIKVQTGQGLLAGQRRNAHWEPVPWDDAVTAETVQGMNPLKMEGRTIGHIEVYLSPRADKAGIAAAARREVRRFALFALMSTAIFLLLLWQWGDLARLGNVLLRVRGKNASADAEFVVESAIHFGGTAPSAESAAMPAMPVLSADTVISPSFGAQFQRTHAESWQITAGLFRQSFACAPELMSRLYANGETAGLCRLGLTLEQAAPCLGAGRLALAARLMQAALTDSMCQTASLSVEECITALEDVLMALNQPEVA